MKMFCTKGICIVTGLQGLNMQTLRRQDWTRFSWGNNVYNVKFSLETRSERGFAMEYKYVQWL